MAIGVSLVFVYKASYSTIRTSERTIIFFNDIAARGEDEFVNVFREEFRVTYVNDMLRQFSLNSQRLHERFRYLQQGYKYTALAIGPWLIAVMYSAALNHHVKL